MEGLFYFIGFILLVGYILLKVLYHVLNTASVLTKNLTGYREKSKEEKKSEDYSVFKSRRPLS